MRTWMAAALMGIVMCPGASAQAAAPASQPATLPGDGPVQAPTRPTDFLTEKQLVQAYRARQFPLLMKEIFRIRNDPTVLRNYDKFNLLLLAAETSLQLKNPTNGMQLFKESAKIAPDERKRDIVLATVMLLERSHDLKYVSKTADDNGQLLPGKLGRGGAGLAGAGRISLLDLGKRPAALHALFLDELAAANSLVEQVSKMTTMKAAEPAFKSLEDLAIAETAVQGEPAEAKKLEQKMAQQVGLLITNSLKQMATTARKADALAQRLVPAESNPGGVNMAGRGASDPSSYMRARGLTRQEADELNGMVTTCEQVDGECQKIAGRLHVEGDFFKSVVADAATTKETITAVLDRATIMAN